MNRRFLPASMVLIALAADCSPVIQADFPSSLDLEFSRADIVAVGRADYSCNAESICVSSLTILRTYKGDLALYSKVKTLEEPDRHGFSNRGLIAGRNYIAFLCKHTELAPCPESAGVYPFPQSLEPAAAPGMDGIIQQLTASSQGKQRSDYEPALKLLIGSKAALDRAALMKIKTNADSDERLLLDAVLISRSDFADSLDDLLTMATAASESHLPDTSLFINAWRAAPAAELSSVIPILARSADSEIRKLALVTIQKDQTNSHTDALLSLMDDPRTEISFGAIKLSMASVGLSKVGMPSYKSFDQSEQVRNALKLKVKRALAASGPS